MKKNRKFLIPLAALASVFVTGHASANIQDETLATQSQSTAADAINTLANNSLVVGKEDLFKFVLERNDQGVMVAEHYSHASHSSHSSHSSHYSGY